MSIEQLQFAEPFFAVKYICDESEYEIGPKSILFNLSRQPVQIRHQGLRFFRSTVITHLKIKTIARSIIIEDFEKNRNLDALYAAIKKKWPIVYDATHEQRHRGVQLYRSSKVKLGDDTEMNMCFVDSIPLNVGLHRTHWGERPFREVHTQILGVGRMQQCLEQNIATLYREDYMAPGVTHEPMYDEHCEYPWHQYEPVTKGIFMATEMQRED